MEDVHWETMTLYSCLFPNDERWATWMRDRLAMMVALHVLYDTLGFEYESRRM